MLKPYKTIEQGTGALNTRAIFNDVASMIKSVSSHTVRKGEHHAIDIDIALAGSGEEYGIE